MLSDNSVFINKTTQTNLDGVLVGDGHFVRETALDEEGGIASCEYVADAIKFLGDVVSFRAYTDSYVTSIPADVPDRKRTAYVIGYAAVIDYLNNYAALYFLSIGPSAETRAYKLVDANNINPTFSYNSTTKKLAISFGSSRSSMGVYYFISRD